MLTKYSQYNVSQTGIVTRPTHTTKYEEARVWQSKEHKQNEAYKYAGILRDFHIIPRKGNGASRKYQRALGILLACKNPIEMNRVYINLRDGYMKI